MDSERLSLHNSLIRQGLKHNDQLSSIKFLKTLCANDDLKTHQFIAWFTGVGQSCHREHKKITRDQAMVRMWMLGNLDIQSIKTGGEPNFVFTRKGLNKINNIPKERWFESLLHEEQILYRNEECSVS